MATGVTTELSYDCNTHFSKEYIKNGHKLYEKMFSISKHQGNACKNHNSLVSVRKAVMKKRENQKEQEINVGKCVERRKYLYTVM